MPRRSHDTQEHHPSWMDDDYVVLRGTRQWKRKDMMSIDSQSVRAIVDCGKAKVLCDFLSKDGTLFQPTAQIPRRPSDR